ncbi:MAG: hypothetical protein Q4C67_10120 [Deinococcus sp.]|nr:hypothetical protein [Deinococcus sp.]
MVTGLLLLLALVGGALALWQLSGSGPNYQSLDAAAWRQASAGAPPVANPRRHMAYAAQDWLEAQEPARFQVYNFLGPADAFPADSTEAYRVGCGFTSPGCKTEDWLVVQYGADGRVASTAFQPAGYLPAASAR